MSSFFQLLMISFPSFPGFPTRAKKPSQAFPVPGLSLGTFPGKNSKKWLISAVSPFPVPGFSRARVGTNLYNKINKLRSFPASLIRVYYKYTHNKGNIIPIPLTRPYLPALPNMATTGGRA